MPGHLARWAGDGAEWEGEEGAAMTFKPLLPGQFEPAIFFRVRRKVPHKVIKSVN